MLASSGDIHTK